jgi:hypothetical protein
VKIGEKRGENENERNSQWRRKVMARNQAKEKRSEAYHGK